MDLPTSPSTFDSSTQSQKSFVIYDNPLFVPTTDMHDNEECYLNMLYDNALDDGPMFIDNPPCLVVTTLCEDKK